MATQLFANNATGALASGITNVATSLTLVSGQGAFFPTPSGGDWFLLTLTQATGPESSWEIVKCTGRSADTLTVVRGQEGTAGAAWSTAKAELRVTAGTLVPAVAAGQSGLLLGTDKTKLDATTGTNTGDETLATIKTKLSITTLSGSNTGDQTLPTLSSLGAQASGTYASGTGSASGTNTGDETTATIKTKLSISTLSGSNTGDQTLPTLASLGAQAAGTYATGTGTASGTNTGDETLATIKSKLGITTLSGSNTGDQTLPTTLPANDVYPWAKASVKPTYFATEVAMALVVVSATTQTAVAGSHYVLTNAAATTLTLPASPAAGDPVWITGANGLLTNVIARNGQTIMGSATDLTMNIADTTVQLRFVNSSWRLL